MEHVVDQLELLIQDQHLGERIIVTVSVEPICDELRVESAWISARRPLTTLRRSSELTRPY